MSRVRAHWRWWLLAALLWFAPLNTPHLFDPDEGRYAEIPREMVASGDWVTPRLDAIKYFEKPVLQYWTTAAAYVAFGEHPWSVRLWPALCGFGGLLLTFALGRRLYDARTALLATLVQGSALLYVALSRFATLDMSLTFALQLALAALLLLSQQPLSSRVTRLSLLLGLGIALAVLTKGLVGLLVPGAVAVVFMVLYRQPSLLWRSQPWWALAVLLVLAAPWFVLVSRRNPEFAHFFFIYQHFERYLNSTGFDRYQPAWFFVPVLLVGLLPWSTLLPRTLLDGWRAARGGDRAAGMLLIWSAFVFVFFSASQSKLVPYIAPLLPAMALLMGRTLAQMAPMRLVLHLRMVAGLGALIAVVAWVLPRLPAAFVLLGRTPVSAVVGLGAAFAALALAAWVGLGLLRQQRLVAAVIATSIGGLLLVYGTLFAADGLKQSQDPWRLAQALRPHLSAATQVYCVNDYLQPLPFYLERPCTLVGYRGELDFGLAQEPQRFLGNLAALAPVWERQSDALAVLRPQDYQQFMAMGAPMRVIYTAPSFVAVVKP